MKVMMWSLLGLLALGLVLVAWRFLAPISTPPFRGPDGRPQARSIASVERWRINGVDQSVILRGRDVANPILVWVHGGPGSSTTSVQRHFNAALEDHFVVAYWDQRHAGQSLKPFGPRPHGLTIQLYVDDLNAVVDRLRARFHRDRVLVVGHSWGTVPGVLFAEQHPEKTIAYVGVSQVANVPVSEARSYAFALGEARRRGNAKAIAELERLGPPPRVGAPIFTPRDWLTAFGGAFHGDLNNGKLIGVGLAAPEANWRDLAAFQLGGAFASDLILGEFSRFVIDGRPRAFGAPVFLLSGRYDRQSEASVSHHFFEQVRAPRKDFVWFENSAHSPPFEEPEAFNGWMIRTLPPLAGAGDLGR